MTLPATSIDRSTLLFRLAVLTRRWSQLLDNEFQHAGLTAATWRPLLHLHLLGEGVRQKDLASSIGIEGPSLVRLVDTLAAKGLIERSIDATDRRAKLLCLTGPGRAVFARIHATVLNLEGELLSPFNDSEFSRVAGFVERLEGTVSTVRRRSRS